MFKETSFSSTSSTEVFRHIPEPLSVVGGQIEQLRQLPDQLFHMWQNRNRVRSQHEHWDNIQNIEYTLDPLYREKDALRGLFHQNFIAFTGEYCLGEVLKEFEMTITPGRGVFGMTNSFQKELSEYGAGFIQKVKEKGKNTSRAELELVNMQRLDEWSITAPVGATCVWFSPPGEKSTGYHGAGRKNHSFVFVYHKLSETKAVMRQYRAWPSSKQLADVQVKLGFPPDSTPGTPRSLQLIENMVFANTPELETQLLEQLYSTEKSWAVKRTDMPQVTLAHFEKERDKVFTFYFHHVLQVTRNTKLHLPKTHPFWKKEYPELVRLMDELFSCSYQALLKWVEDEDALLKGKKVKVNGKKTSAENVTFDGPDSNHPINIYGPLGLAEIWQKRSLIVQGLATREDIAQLNKAAPLILSTGKVFGRVLSVGHCGIGTFLPTQVATGLELAIQTPPLNILTPEHTQHLTPQQKEHLKKNLAEFVPFTITDREGNLHQFWVKQQYLKEYQDSCYQDEDGVFKGPCHIDLKIDENILSDEKYQQLSELLAQEARSPEQEISENIEQLEKQLLTTTTGDSEKQQHAKELIKDLKKIIRPSVSLLQFLNNDVIQPTLHLAALPLLHRLRNSLHPLAELDQFIREYVLQNTVSQDGPKQGIILGYGR